MASLADEIGVHLSESREETIGIINDLRMISVGDAQAVVGDNVCFESTHPDPGMLVGRGKCLIRSNHLDRICQVVNTTNGDDAVTKVCSQHIVRKSVASFGYCIEDVCGH